MKNFLYFAVCVCVDVIIGIFRSFPWSLWVSYNQPRFRLDCSCQWILCHKQSV